VPIISGFVNLGNRRQDQSDVKDLTGLTSRWALDYALLLRKFIDFKHLVGIGVFLDLPEFQTS
jgi:hypothetical protein